MELKESFRNLLTAQKGLLKEFDSLVGELEASDLVNQNIELKKELESYKHLVEETKKNYTGIKNENDSLKIALKEQILDEKLNLLKISRKKIETYFQDAGEQYNNGLIAVEQKAKERLQEIKRIASLELGEDKANFLGEVDRLYMELQNKIREKWQNQADIKQRALSDMEEDYKRLEAKGISEEEIQKRIKQNNLEVKIGLNFINKAGILLILIGMATGLGYSYTSFFTPVMKGIFAFVIGGLFLAAGEWFNRKEKNAVALGLTGGGIGTLYLAVFNCFFVLEIIDINLAIIISTLVTLAAFTLSLIYDSKTICSLALIGGFLPFFSYSSNFKMDAAALYIAMGYLFILNLLTLLVSLFKKWDVVNYISFLLNIPTLIYLVFKVPSEAAAILYCILTFSMYLVIILAHPFRHKTGLKALDSILLALNTAISCILVFVLFESSKAIVFGDLMLKDLKGLLAVLFCLVYFSLGQFTDRKMSSEKFARVLFYLTSFTFAVLMIPFQFGVKWLAMGWLVEGTLMIIYGFRSRLKSLEIGGWIVYGLCCIVFFAADYLPFILHFRNAEANLFYFKYSAVILGSIFILLTYLIELTADTASKFTRRGKLIGLYKYFSIITFWIYLSYMAHQLYDTFIASRALNNSLYQTFILAFVTMLTGYMIIKVPMLYDKVVKYFSVFMFVIADLICIYLNFAEPVFRGNTASSYLSLGILLLFNALAFLCVRDIILTFLKKGRANFEFYPLLMGIYLLGNLVLLLEVQMDRFIAADINLVISLLFVVFSLFYIIFGFKKHYSYMRRLGLGLSIFSTAKLFIFDLRNLETVGRIVSYFAFGLVLLGISFVYQRFKKSMELQETPTKAVE